MQAVIEDKYVKIILHKIWDKAGVWKVISKVGHLRFDTNLAEPSGKYQIINYLISSLLNLKYKKDRNKGNS